MDLCYTALIIGQKVRNLEPFWGTGAKSGERCQTRVGSMSLSTGELADPYKHFLPTLVGRAGAKSL